MSGLSRLMLVGDREREGESLRWIGGESICGDEGKLATLVITSLSGDSSGLRCVGAGWPEEEVWLVVSGAVSVIESLVSPCNESATSASSADEDRLPASLIILWSSGRLLSLLLLLPVARCLLRLEGAIFGGWG